MEVLRFTVHHFIVHLSTIYKYFILYESAGEFSLTFVFYFHLTAVFLDLELNNTWFYPFVEHLCDLHDTPITHHPVGKGSRIPGINNT